MKKLVARDPGTKYFCIPYPEPRKSKIEVIHRKETIEFQDPDTGKTFQAQLQDMLWYPMTLISDFASKVCLQMTARELKTYMMKQYKLSERDKVCIVQFCKKD